MRTGSSVTTGVTSAGDPGLSSGFWLRSINNHVRDNVVANADFVGFIFYPKGVGEIKVHVSWPTPTLHHHLPRQ